ncbi:response regulator transcription factor [Ktedonobacteria bacterium brp13]|nr:response regulator transcription factor [Ktedonobacteria bacterium brp13]
MKLLLVDSDQSMLTMLATWLKSLGYEVTCAISEEQMRSVWIEQQPDIVIISSIPALALCGELRSTFDALILALDEGTDIKDEIRCLEAGADDYMRKPFYPDLLLAHIHALSRRIRGAELSQTHSNSIIQAGPIRVDLLHNEACVHHKVVRLTPTESKILHLLVRNAGHVCTQNQIVSYVWEYATAEVKTLIKPHIYNLRQKIELHPQKPLYILTIPHTGYMLAQVKIQPTPA